MRVLQPGARKQRILESELHQHQDHGERDSGDGGGQTPLILHELEPGERNAACHWVEPLFLTGVADRPWACPTLPKRRRAAGDKIMARTRRSPSRGSAPPPACCPPGEFAPESLAHPKKQPDRWARPRSGPPP